MCDNSNIDIGIVKDILLIIGSITSIMFAFLGYNKWKKELKGRVKFELTRTVLKELYLFRDSFKYLRSPLTSAHEFPPNHDPLNYNESETNHYVFTNRFKDFGHSYNSIYSILPEIELEFEPELFELIRELLNQVVQYKIRLNEFIQLSGKTNNDEYLQELRKIVYDIGEDNPTTKKFMNAVDKIESKLKNKRRKY